MIVLEELCKRINNAGCRVAIPQSEHAPVAVMFGGLFDNAEYIAGQLNIYGVAGNVLISDIVHVARLTHDKYCILCSDKATGAAVYVTVYDNGRAER